MPPPGPMELENIVANTVLLKAREGERRRRADTGPRSWGGAGGRQARGDGVAGGPGAARPPSEPSAWEVPAGRWPEP